MSDHGRPDTEDTDDADDADDQVRQVLTLERELQTSACRTDPLRVAQLIADDFVEIGSSGTVWDHDSTLRMLAAEDPSAAPIEVHDLTGRAVADGVVLVCWDSVRGNRTARRTSLWRRDPGGWRIVHHQGTPLPAPSDRRSHPTRVTGHVRASRAEVYRALLDPATVAVWRVPAGMTGQVHEFEPREGGSLRISLTYKDADAQGKTRENTDTYHGHFVRLVPDECVVESLEFESSDPGLRGRMTMTTTLSDAADGTEVTIVHEGLPSAVSPTDNETGTRMALRSLADLLEADRDR